MRPPCELCGSNDHSAPECSAPLTDDDDFGPPQSVEVDVNLVINNLQQGWMSQVANLQWVNAQLSAKAEEMERRWREAEMRIGALQGALVATSPVDDHPQEGGTGLFTKEQADEFMNLDVSPADDHPSEDAILQMSALASGQPGLGGAEREAGPSDPTGPLVGP
jgi:hypothetical protein